MIVSATLILPKQGWMDKTNTSEFEHLSTYVPLPTPSCPWLTLWSLLKSKFSSCTLWEVTEESGMLELISHIISPPKPDVSYTFYNRAITCKYSKWMAPLKLHQVHAPSLFTVLPDFKQRMILTLFSFTNYLIRWDISTSDWLKKFLHQSNFVFVCTQHSKILFSVL